MQGMCRTSFFSVPIFNYIIIIEVNIYLMDLEFKGKPIGQLWDHLNIRKNNEYNWLKYIDWKWKEKNREEHFCSRLVR